MPTAWLPAGPVQCSILMNKEAKGGQGCCDWLWPPLAAWASEGVGGVWMLKVREWGTYGWWKEAVCGGLGWAATS